MGDNKKPGIFVCYGQMWKRAFDFKGISSKYEYFGAFSVNATVFLILSAACFLCRFENFFPAVLIAISAYFLLSVIPFIALSVRRLHDIGKPGIQILPVFLLPIVGLIIVAAICIFSNAAYYSINNAVAVYGPPEDFDSPAVTDEFDPAGNEAICVYGPPPEDYSAAEQTTADTDESDPTKNVTVDVYGPPSEDYSEPEQTTAALDDFDPTENIAIDVYGPPEYFETSNEPSDGDTPTATSNGDAE